MGLPIIINDRNSWSTPAPLAYQSVNASIPFGKGYDKYWVRKEGRREGGREGGRDLVPRVICTYISSFSPFFPPSLPPSLLQMLEVHFIRGDGAESKRINQAGFVIDYSSTLRQHDMGAFVMVREERRSEEGDKGGRERCSVGSRDEERKGGRGGGRGTDAHTSNHTHIYLCPLQGAPATSHPLNFISSLIIPPGTFSPPPSLPSLPPLLTSHPPSLPPSL